MKKILGHSGESGRVANINVQELEILHCETMQILYRPILPERICLESRTRLHRNRSTGLTGCMNGESVFVDF